ncbi:MAG: hypothetical protein ACK5KM_14450 [Hyphomicrobiaceae bacterium]
MLLQSAGTAPAYAASASRANAEFAKAEHVLAFISSYREEKEQKRIPGMVHAMGQLGMLREPEEAGIYIGFLAGIIRDSGSGARDLIEQMFPMPPSDQVILIKAIVFSERGDWRNLLAEFVERMPARKVLIDRYLYRDGAGLDGLMTEATGAFAVDVYWGLFFATGDPGPARRIIAALAWTADRDSVEKLTIGSMAKWTLATNATRDKDLRDLMKSEMNTQPAVVRGPLADVIEAAETFETKRIKNDALKAIEELKLKGPQSHRDTVWWGPGWTNGTGAGLRGSRCHGAGASWNTVCGWRCLVLCGPQISRAATSVSLTTSTVTVVCDLAACVAAQLSIVGGNL